MGLFIWEILEYGPNEPVRDATAFAVGGRLYARISLLVAFEKCPFAENFTSLNISDLILASIIINHIDCRIAHIQKIDLVGNITLGDNIGTNFKSLYAHTLQQLIQKIFISAKEEFVLLQRVMQKSGLQSS